MKMFIKSSLAVVIASSALIACIDNTVSPEVQQARAAQVNYLNAVTAYQTAQADYQKAQADYQVLLNAKLETQNSVDVANAATTIKEAEANLAAATQNLANYLADHQMDVANTYVNGYNDATNQISNLLSQKASKASDIAYAQQLTDNWSGISFDLLKEEYQRDLDAETAILATQEAGLAALQAVVSTPTKAEAQTQLDDINAQLLALTNAQVGFDVEESELDKTYNEANTKVNNAQQAISNQNNWTAQLASVNTDITNQTVAVASAQTDLNTANATLTAKTTILASSKAALAPKLTAYNSQLALIESKQNAYDVATANVTIAQNNYNANPTAANQTALDNATAAQTSAQTALNTANSDMTAIQDAKNAAQSQVDVAQNDVDNAQSNVDNNTSNLANQQTYLSDYNVQKTNIQALIDSNQAAYDDAIANLESYKVALDAADRAYTDLNDRESANYSAYNNLSSIQYNLEQYVSNGSGIDQAIENQKDAIENTKENVENAQHALADNDISKAEAQALVVKLQGDLDAIDANIDAQTAIAAKFKALLDAELGS